MKAPLRLSFFFLLLFCGSLFAIPDINIPIVPPSDLGFHPEPGPCLGCDHHHDDNNHHNDNDHHDHFDHHHDYPYPNNPDDHHGFPYDHHDHHDYPYIHPHRDLPYGSYKDTCNYCHVDDQVLYCVCDDRNQFPQNTSLNLYHCYRHNLDVINENGQLTCGNEVTEEAAINQIQLFLKIQ